MAKARTDFLCQSCGYNSPKWVGKCPSCGDWNTFVEEVVSKPKTRCLHASVRPSQCRSSFLRLGMPKNKDFVTRPGVQPHRWRWSGAWLSHIDRGEPGIGKSTLLLQLALQWQGLKVLYVSGEESEQQIRMRAQRLGIGNSECVILTETSTTLLFKHFKQVQPELVIIDSIQTVYSELIDSTPGSVSQIRECTGEFVRLQKRRVPRSFSWVISPRMGA
jgi:DNA repair protein RadA/Sms